MEAPILPYAGTSGWSGSETSRDRAVTEDGDGTTTRRQAQALWFLEQQHRYGATWKELAEWYGWHHGQASGVLSVLHKAGKIERLTLRRMKCAVYVLPDNIMGRELSKRRNKCCPHCGGEL